MAPVQFAHVGEMTGASFYAGWEWDEEANVLGNSGFLHSSMRKGWGINCDANGESSTRTDADSATTGISGVEPRVVE